MRQTRTAERAQAVGLWGLALGRSKRQRQNRPIATPAPAPLGQARTATRPSPHRATCSRACGEIDRRSPTPLSSSAISQHVLLTPCASLFKSTMLPVTRRRDDECGARSLQLQKAIQRSVAKANAAPASSLRGSSRTQLLLQRADSHAPVAICPHSQRWADPVALYVSLRAFEVADPSLTSPDGAFTNLGVPLHSLQTPRAETRSPFSAQRVCRVSNSAWVCAQSARRRWERPFSFVFSGSDLALTRAFHACERQVSSLFAPLSDRESAGSREGHAGSAPLLAL